MTPTILKFPTRRTGRRVQAGEIAIKRYGVYLVPTEQLSSVQHKAFDSVEGAKAYVAEWLLRDLRRPSDLAVCILPEGGVRK